MKRDDGAASERWQKNEEKKYWPLMIANPALDIENGSPAACNRDRAIPFPVPVAHCSAWNVCLEHHQQQSAQMLECEQKLQKLQATTNLG